MNNRKMLEEAIADAKAVKEMAIANAKAALEEAFNPQLKSMLADKLMEMEDLDEEETEVEEAYSKEEVEELSNPVMRHGLKGDDAPERETEKMREEEDMDEEMDLDELLAELEKDEDSLNEDARTDAEEEGYEDGMEDEKEDEEEDEDEEIDLEEMSEDDLKSFIEDVIADMVTAGELEAGDEFESEDVEVEDDEEIEVEDEVEVTMDENARTDAEEEGYKDGIKDEKEDIKKDLKEAMDTVATLKSELNEINLLNAKLLYVNKIFRSKNLTESQKSKVLAAFDKAGSVNEAKLVFETISENLTTTKKEIVKENLSRASKAAGVAPKQPIMEIDSQVSRWQKLAGIK